MAIGIILTSSNLETPLINWFELAHSKINQWKVAFGPNLFWTYRRFLLLSAFAVHLQDWKIEKKMGRIIFQCYQLFVKPVFVSLLLVIGGRVGGCRGHAIGISFFFTIFQSIFCSSVTIILIFIFFGLVRLSLQVSEIISWEQWITFFSKSCISPPLLIH